MTIDRQQIRRDAEDLLLDPEGNLTRRVAENCLAILTELEQVEEEADQLDNRLDAANLRLANVPPLIEAARQVLDQSYPPEQGPARRQLRAALAAYENNGGAT